jgi:hypothetical protein
VKSKPAKLKYLGQFSEINIYFFLEKKHLNLDGTYVSGYVDCFPDNVTKLFSADVRNQVPPDRSHAVAAAGGLAHRHQGEVL